jgi:uncharacterized membrane protein YoaK (UPF0700 family)
MITPRRARSFSAWARVVVSHRRVPVNDDLLATILAGVAGAINAGGFFVVGQYTSHMTGYLSRAADHIAIGNLKVAFTCFLAIGAFIGGAALSAFLINAAKMLHFRAQYALPIGVQGLVLLFLSLVGNIAAAGHNFLLLMVLCILMGMQNATITKVSRARIRTTHVTGMVTDIGIELGRSVFGFTTGRRTVQADTRKLLMLLRLVSVFLLGGVLGAAGFSNLGFMTALPLSLVLLLISVPTLHRSTKQSLA